MKTKTKKFKTKSFRKLIEKILTKSEIAEIELEAQIEQQVLLDVKLLKSKKFKSCKP